MSEPRYTLDDFNEIPGYVHGQNGAAHQDSWHPYYLSGIQDDSTIPPSLGHNLIYPGLRHVFSGPQESAKTLAAYAIGINIIRAHPGSQILLLDFEMGPRGAKRRWRDLGATDHELDNQILYLAPDTPAILDRILILVAINPTLVIIDAAAGAFDNEELDDNSRKDAEKWRKLYVDPFFDNGIATIVLDHVVKNAESRGKYTIGSERKTGGGEVHFGFDTVKPIRRGTTGIYKMTVHKDREGHHARGHFMDLHVSSDPVTHTLSCEFRPVAHAEDGTVQLPTELMQRVSHYLEGQEAEPATRNQIVLNTKGKAEHVGRAIDHLVDLKFVEESTGSNRARLYTCLRPFIRSEWENTHPPQVLPGSSPVLPEEPVSGSSLPSPPTGTGRTHDAPGRPQVLPAADDDPEVRALLAHYDLLPAEPEDPPADLFEQPVPATTTNNDDLPL